MGYGIEGCDTNKVFGGLSFGNLTIKVKVLIAEHGMVITSTIIISPHSLILLVDVWLFESNSYMLMTLLLTRDWVVEQGGGQDDL